MKTGQEQHLVGEVVPKKGLHNMGSHIRVELSSSGTARGHFVDSLVDVAYILILVRMAVALDDREIPEVSILTLFAVTLSHEKSPQRGIEWWPWGLNDDTWCRTLCVIGTMTSPLMRILFLTNQDIMEIEYFWFLSPLSTSLCSMLQLLLHTWGIDMTPCFQQNTCHLVAGEEHLNE